MNIVSAFLHQASNVYSTVINPLVKRTKSIYLRYSAPAVYTVIAASAAVSSWYAYHNQLQSPFISNQRVSVCLNASVAVGAAFQAFQAIKEEIYIRRNQANLQKLADRMNEVAEVDAPLVVIFHCESDHNGAFDVSRARFASLKKECRVIVVPVMDPYEIEGHLEQIALRSKISHVILSGHGTSDRVEFRVDKLVGSQIGALTSSMITPRMFHNIDPQGTVLLDSCSTGIPGGIGQQISTKGGLRVQAPYEDANGGAGWAILDPVHGLVFLSLNDEMEPITFTYKNGEIIPSPTLDIPHLRKVASELKDAFLMTYVALHYLKKGNPDLARTILLESFNLELPKGVNVSVFKMQDYIRDQVSQVSFLENGS